MTDTWCIDTGTDKLVLRRLPAHLPSFKVRLSVAAQHRAARAGLAPKLLRTEGGFLVAEHDTRTYTLSRFATDTRTLTAPTDVPTARHLGTALGHLHRVLATIAAVKVSDRWQLPDHGPLREALAAHSRPGCNHPDAARFLQTKRSWAAKLQARDRKQLNSLPQQVIHGDIHPGNILAAAR